MITMRQYKTATVAIFIALVVLLGVVLYKPVMEARNESAARAVVEEFGARMKNVSTTAEPDIARPVIDQNYSGLVTAELLAQWDGAPATAPGRPTSSPYPDEIEISSITPQGSGFIVTGDVVQATASEGPIGKTPVILMVIKQDGDWRIAAYQEQQIAEE